ncbi:hypothetical protein WHX56_14265 [Achromobacter veterisilvae]|uniref:Uncharacterized protein n=1 Tax=Achromobacter veterisilvae TaxID=2069367 RepID=A0ABZ2S8L4_9BURK
MAYERRPRESLKTDPDFYSNILDIQPVFSTMPFKDPLTAEQLSAIKARQPWNSDIVALLWEISRLRSFILRANQLSGDLQRPHGILGTVFDDWIQQIHAEPCVLERDQVTRELLDMPGKPRKGMAPR